LWYRGRATSQQAGRPLAALSGARASAGGPHALQHPTVRGGIEFRQPFARRWLARPDGKASVERLLSPDLPSKPSGYHPLRLARYLDFADHHLKKMPAPRAE